MIGIICDRCGKIEKLKDNQSSSIVIPEGWDKRICYDPSDRNPHPSVKHYCKDCRNDLTFKRNCPFCDADPINLSLIISESGRPAIYCNECDMVAESADPNISAKGLIKIWNKEGEE